MGILGMTKYSISEAARQLGVQRRTLYKWIREKHVPAPTTQIVAGVRITYWTEKGMKRLRAHKSASYWGRGKKRNRTKKASH
jgi:excisionase family DNA binding protein